MSTLLEALGGTFAAAIEAHGMGVAALTVRALGMLALLPFGSSPQLVALRLVFSLGLALCAYAPEDAAVWFGQSTGIQSLGVWLGLWRELLLGLCLGLPVALVLALVSMCAELLESVRGQNLSSFIDPLGAKEWGDSEPSFSVLGRTYVWALLLLSGLGERLVSAYVQSARVPLPTASTLQVLETFVQFVVHATLSALEWSFLIAGWFSVVALAVEVSAGWVSKALPQVSFMNETFLIKTALLWSMTVVSWHMDVFSSLHELSRPIVPAAFDRSEREGMAGGPVDILDRSGNGRSREPIH